MSSKTFSRHFQHEHDHNRFKTRASTTPNHMTHSCQDKLEKKYIIIVVTAYIYLKRNVITTEFPVLNKIEINARILTIY